jgi:uncharacterized protein YdbL (DUF1318 family)
MPHSLNTKFHRRAKGTLAIAAAFVSFLAMAPANGAGAPTAEQLRGEGKACEQSDGFLRAVNPADQGVVDQINGRRRAAYQQEAAAAGGGTDVAAVGALYAQSVIPKQPNYRACPN